MTFNNTNEYIIILLNNQKHNQYSDGERLVFIEIANERSSE